MTQIWKLETFSRRAEALLLLKFADKKVNVGKVKITVATLTPETLAWLGTSCDCQRGRSERKKLRCDRRHNHMQNRDIKKYGYMVTLHRFDSAHSLIVTEPVKTSVNMAKHRSSDALRNRKNQKWVVTCLTLLGFSFFLCA